MVQSLIQRIRENKLDALYLFINESLRDRNAFDVFFNNLMAVLPNNWSINRVEIGHEFLSRTVAADQDGNANPEDQNSIAGTSSKQDQLFQWVCSLESLRSLIISDGYIPRKDHGFLNTKAFLKNLPRASNLQYLDVQRLRLRITSEISEGNDSEYLAESLDSLSDSLEDLRLTAISMCNTTSFGGGPMQCEMEWRKRRYPLDATVRICGGMANLQSLVLSCANGCGCKCDNGEDQQSNSQQGGQHNPVGENTLSESPTPIPTISSCLISKEVLLDLCRSSSTLQELALRSMRIDDDTCKTIAKAFDSPHNHGHPNISSSAMVFPGKFAGDNVDTDHCDDGTEDVQHHSPSFWTSLDLRQNPFIGTDGYNAILSSLERNYDLWCSLMVDDECFQSKFNALIELNQANRGSLVRSPSPEKLAVFLDRLKDDPTALQYFLTIHRDSILLPLIRYLAWKNSICSNRSRQQSMLQMDGNPSLTSTYDEIPLKRPASTNIANNSGETGSLSGANGSSAKRQRQSEH